MPLLHRICLTTALLVTLFDSFAWGADRSSDLAFFENQVRPLLAQHCYKCHGEKEQEGDLRLDDYAAMMRGGASGAALVVGKPDESLLLAAVGYANEELRMPPDKKLADAEIKILRDWVSRGLPHPDSETVSVVPQKKVDLDEGRKFWAFQPPQASPLPPVRNSEWVRTPIDYFILNALETKGLQPSPISDKRTWIRRVSLALIGLPPTSFEVDEFLSDESSLAYQRVIDRLLSSPRYGERWGRHWLDVVRYADSNGLDENVAHGNAWRYRDYVISSFNADKPFDQFAREQIAGDLLPAETEARRHEQLIATGFYALGPKVLAEVDERKMEMDIVDEQIDTFGRAFLGLTLGCARCHDHKFDPIRTDDYYALTGIFQSTRSMESFKKIGKWHENVIATPEELQAKAAYDQQLAEKKGAIQQVVSAADQVLAATSTAGSEAKKEGDAKYPESVQAELKKLREDLAKLEKTPPPISTAMGVAEGTAVDAAICLRGSHLTRGKIVPRGIPEVLITQPVSITGTASGRLEVANWLSQRDNPVVARVAVNRIWRWHFGRGLVESTDNFGKLGDRPVNQALLDWLAVWFMDHEWSVKELHRLILGSAVSMQSSASRPSGSAVESVDPENRLLWRFPIRRMEVEAIRDSLLAVSDKLDLKMGGSLLHVGNREYLFDHTSKDNTNYDSTRRTVYLPVIRNNQYDMTQLFDATDATVPSGDRSASTVPTQALFMLNSRLMVDVAEGLAKGAAAVPGSDSERIQWLYSRCFSRTASEAEVERCVTFLAGMTPANTNSPNGDERHAAWTALCHTLLASNEFIYVR